ncbi:MAG: glycoside hydrolase family 2 protein, partial [Clostridia bacterium]|nr:glycoside hydrolase family 2 protein [Clostridia bacterium]
MRNVLNFNAGWSFAKDVKECPAALCESWETINLPHTWNATDGQDGNNDYFRGTCCYAKQIVKSELPAADRYYLEIRGANSSADVYVDGKSVAHHDGGYSTWRVDLTDHIAEQSLISILVDNAPNDRVYPQMADFTFYGGLYRNVNLICVANEHFDLDYYGAPGIMVTPKIE